MAQDLDHTAKNRTLSTLGARLKNCLDGDPTTASTINDRILALAGDPELRSAAQAALPTLTDEAKPADPMLKVRIMEPYQEPYNRTPRTKDQWKAFWLVYVEALEGISAPALKAALAEAVKQPTREFFPAPGPLLALCEKHQDTIARRRRIIQAALAIPAGSDDPDAAKSAYSATFAETQP